MHLEQGFVSSESVYYPGEHPGPGPGPGPFVEYKEASRLTEDQVPQQTVVSLSPREEQEGSFPQDGALSCSVNFILHFSFEETEAQRCPATEMQGSVMGLIMIIMAGVNISTVRGSSRGHSMSSCHIQDVGGWVGLQAGVQRARDFVRKHS